ncbi:hypothetical protein G6F22_013556 [Rhizopus arrhizus]|nr:hypothetical protein G6F22_013556 [Rhizopus arrhizus]
MLGTLLGMMDTLRGTGLALQSATDMAAIRGSLASPVQGLAVAFGTSIAGVASSAMLGLLAALLRRDRLQAVQQLDRAIAGDLHPYSQAWQRAESLRLLQAQSAALPALVDRLQAMTQTFEQHSTAANERLLAGQAEFLTQSQALQERLAVSLQQSLREGAEASAAAIGGALQPMAETTLAGLAQHGQALHARVEQAVQQQLAGLSDGGERADPGTAGAGERPAPAPAGLQRWPGHARRSAGDTHRRAPASRCQQQCRRLARRRRTAAGTEYRAGRTPAAGTAGRQRASGRARRGTAASTGPAPCCQPVLAAGA